MDEHKKMDETIQKIMKNVEDSARRNQQKPISRPKRNAEEERLNWQMQLMQAGIQQKDPSKSQPKASIISGQSHTCKKRFEELKPICLNEMKVPMVHEGRFLVCQVISTPFCNISTNTQVQDLNDEVESLSFYNFTYDLTDASWLTVGQILIIKDPYLKYGLINQQEQKITLIVESPSDVIFVDSTDEEFLRKIGAEKWHVQSTQDPEKIKGMGNEMFLKKEYLKAMHLYDRAIRYAPNLSVLYLNKASTCLRSGHFYLAYEAAKLGMEKGGDREKALHRMGLASYGMRNWQSAVNYFKELREQFPNNPDASKELKRSTDRLNEEQTGKFDFKSMYLELKTGQRDFDVSDFTGPIEIKDIPGKGRGIVATKDIKKGTLLLVSKAFAAGYQQDNKQNFITLNSILKRVEKTSNQLQILSIIENLRKNPQKAKELYALYAGSSQTNEEIPEGIIDISKIERIGSYNRFGDELSRADPNDQEMTAEMMLKDACFLFILPSYFNHSCAANASYTLYGNVMVVHATSDLKQGDEISLPYISPLTIYSERKDRLLKHWGFTCKCRLCQIDEKDGNVTKRMRLVHQFENFARTNIKNPKSVLGKGSNFLKQLRELSENRSAFKTDLAHSLIIMANVHNEMGKPGESLKCLEEAIKLIDEELQQPMETTQTLLNLAICYFATRQQGKAKDTIQKAFKTSLCADKEHFKLCYSDALSIMKIPF